MPRTPAPNGRKEGKALLVDAMRALFSEPSVDNIAAHAGVSRELLRACVNPNRPNLPSPDLLAKVAGYLEERAATLRQVATKLRRQAAKAGETTPAK